MTAGSLAAGAPAVAAVRVPCGPRGAETVAARGPVRAYVASRAGEQIVNGCHRDGRQAVLLGRRHRVLDVILAGRFAAVRTRRAEGREHLRVLDLKRGRRRGGHPYDLPRPTVYLRVKLDPRTGVAAYTGVLPRAKGSPRTYEVATTDENSPLGVGPDIDPTKLGFAGDVLAFLQGRTVHVGALNFSYGGRAGPLLELGQLHLSARRTGVIRARLGRGPRVTLGRAAIECTSSSGCGGVRTIQRAGRYVAYFTFTSQPDDQDEALVVADLGSGSKRVGCQAKGGNASTLASFVVTRFGRVACGVMVGDYSAQPRQRPVRQILSEGRVLDEGPGVEPETLVRRGDELVWLHDGEERTAPLP